MAQKPRPPPCQPPDPRRVERPRRNHPAAADAQHGVEGKPVERRRGGDAAGRAETRLAEGTRERFQGRDAPAGRRGKEFEAVEAEVHPAHDIAGVRGAGQERNAARHRRLAEIVGEPWRHNEFGAGMDRTGEHRGVEHGARADDRALDRLHRGQRIERGGGAQRNLEHRQAARDERFRHRHRVFDPVDDDHRNDGGEAHDLVDGLAQMTDSMAARMADPPFSASSAWKRNSAKSSRPTPTAGGGGAAGLRATQMAGSTSASPSPLRAQTRTMSPSARRASGPPMPSGPGRASGDKWITAGTLPLAPDMRPSVRRATRKPRSCNTPNAGGSLCGWGMPWARGP